jgi:hypothetical protein
MISTITEWDFIKAFDRMNRSANFSVEGRKALFDFFEEQDPAMELDVIAICCEFSEYGDLEELKADYSHSVPDGMEDDEDVLEHFQNETLVFELPLGGLVIQSF